MVVFADDGAVRTDIDVDEGSARLAVHLVDPDCDNHAGLFGRCAKLFGFGIDLTQGLGMTGEYEPNSEGISRHKGFGKNHELRAGGNTTGRAPDPGRVKVCPR